MFMLFNKEKLPTQGYLVFGLPVRGGHAIYLPKYKEEENVFFCLYVYGFKVETQKNKHCEHSLVHFEYRNLCYQEIHPKAWLE